MSQSSINQRFTVFLTEKRISQKLFSEITGINTGTVSNISTGATELPKADFFQAFAIHYPEISLRWLLIGEGEMENEPGNYPVMAREPGEPKSYKPATQASKSVEQLSASVESLTAMLKVVIEENQRLRAGEKV